MSCSFDEILVCGTPESTTSPTAAPTLAILDDRSFTLFLDGDFAALQQYLNDNNVSTDAWAAKAIRKLLLTGNDPNLSKVIVTILNVKGGSVIIEGSLKSNNSSVLDLAETVINSADEIQTDGGFIFPVISNRVYGTPSAAQTTSPTQSPSNEPWPTKKQKKNRKRKTSKFRTFQSNNGNINNSQRKGRKKMRDLIKNDAN
eukprot:733150_1